MKGLIIGIVGGAGVGKDTAADYLVRAHGFKKLALADELKRFAKVVFDFTDEQLWGPSASRNKPDPRFRNPEGWVYAYWKLALSVRPWARGLFLDAFVGEKAVYDWFVGLREKYGEEMGGGFGEFSPRIALQTLGTECGRTADQNVWVRTMVRNAEAVLGGRHYLADKGLAGFAAPPTGIVVSDTRFRNEVDAVHEAGGLVLRLHRATSVDPLSLGVKGHASESELLGIPDSVADYVLHVEDGLPAYYAQLDDLVERIRKEHLS